MHKNPAPLNQKYSDDPAEQAFATHVARRTMKLGTALIGHLSSGRIATLSALQDFVWEQALDFTVPMEPDVRDELRAAKTGLPWADRNDLSLYWRLMYAGRVEYLLDTQVAVFDERTVRRPLKQIVCAATILLGQFAKPEGRSDPDFLAALLKPGTTSIGMALYHGIVERAGDQIRIRTGRRHAPEPLELAARVRVGNIMCVVEGYGFDGTVIVSRETEPAEPAAIRWALDTKSGRWKASVWPWQIEASP